MNIKIGNIELGDWFEYNPYSYLKMYSNYSPLAIIDMKWSNCKIQIIRETFRTVNYSWNVYFYDELNFIGDIHKNTGPKNFETLEEAKSYTNNLLIRVAKIIAFT